MLADTLRRVLHRGRRASTAASLLSVPLTASMTVCGAAGPLDEHANLARMLAQASCAEPSAADARFTMLERSPIERGGDVVGERLRYAAGESTLFRVERVAPGGRLARLIVEVSSVSDDVARPELLVFADAACALRGGRRLLWREDGSVEALQILDAGLEPVATPEPLDAQPPAGADPGGVAVAMVDSGVNYLLEAIGSRLARDSEGAPLGYDWWDLDARPFDSHPAGSPFFVQRHGTRTASLMLADAPVAKLVPYRYPRPDMSRMGALLEHADRNGVRIVNLSLGGNKAGEWQSFAAAAAARPHMLFIASAGNDDRDIDSQPVYPASLSLPNLVVVTSADDEGRLAPGSNWGPRSVHLLMPGEDQVVSGFDGHRRFASGSSYAAARASALAACLLAAHPEWRAPQLRDALFALAVTPPQPGLVAIGLLREPVVLVRGACAAEVAEPVLVEAYDLWPPAAAMQTPVARLALSVVLVRDSGWRTDELAPAVAEVAKLLAQCGVVLERAAVREVLAPRRLRNFSSVYSAGLVKFAPPTRPGVFLVDDTLEPDPYEAEAIGRGNASRRRALVDTVWLTRAVRQPGLVMAHELVHLLADSGAHDDDRGNLMHERSAASDGQLDETQCERLVRRGLATGLLLPIAH